MIGIVLLILGITGWIGRLARAIPQSVSAGLQLGLGLLMSVLGLKLILAEDGYYNPNPRLSVTEDPSDAPPNTGAEEAAAATGNEPAASCVPASGAPQVRSRAILLLRP